MFLISASYYFLRTLFKRDVKQTNKKAIEIFNGFNLFRF